MPDEQNMPGIDGQTPVTDTSQAQTEPSKPISKPTLAPQTASNNNKKKLGLLAIIIIALLVLVGGSVGAYYGVIVPNKPENVLKTAFKNTLEQKKSKFSGKFSFEDTGENASVKAVNITFNGQADLDKSAFQATTEVTASGIKVPFEIRGIDKSLYVKVGDLSSLKSVASTLGPEVAPLVDQISKKIADKWIEIDETLLKQANVDCISNANYSLTKEDIDLLINRYKAVPFASVKSSNDTVGGKAAFKYDIEIDNNKGAEYAKGLDELSIMKKLKECDKGNPYDTKSLANNDKTPLTLWVSKSSKQIVKLAGHSTAQNGQKDNMKTSFEMTMQYGQASINKPEGATPLVQILGDFSSLFSGSPIMQTLGISTNRDVNGVSDKCLQALQDYTNSGGTKPIPADCM